ncbi:hypothetical protein [Mucilaginibacter psychrotolerans]|uniref:Uncharacterized protein n=1 Tax=Mucilaginibacter psychrotolerans TaxID=1524096 RepID=A0A4Y8SF20_9SPHI|nr:hypothetical protein [Mucilaginibacter psychrotolerans]TFF37683.1 hypothetical protein E2R66_10975 [Mucilaginibacter psychrotolerans]
MTWMKFAVWLFGFYTLYYAAIIFWDQLRSKRAHTQQDKHELTFVEDIEPIRSHIEESAANDTGSSIASSGGVSLKQMFNLAREEVIEYTRAVSF